MIDQLHLGKQHLRGDQKCSHNLPEDLRQIGGQERADHAAQQAEQDQIDPTSVQRSVDAQVQAQFHIDAGAAEQQQAAQPCFPKATAQALRRLRRLFRHLICIRCGYRVGFCFQHMLLPLRVSSKRRGVLSNFADVKLIIVQFPEKSNCSLKKFKKDLQLRETDR